MISSANVGVMAFRGFSRRVAAAGAKHDQRKAEIVAGVLSDPVDQAYGYDLETRFLHELLDRRSVFVDVGANAGSYSTVAEQVVGSRSVVLVEPLPQLAKALRARFPASTVVEAALSDHEGTARIRVPSIDGKVYNTRATLNDHTEPGQSGTKEVEVALRTLDSCVAELGLRRLDVLKVDVEGHEIELLEGAQGVLARLKPIVIIEIETRHHTFPITEVFERLERQGLRGHLFDPRSMTVLPASEFVTDRDQDLKHLISRDFIRYLNNFWFVPESREAAFLRKAESFLSGFRPLDDER